MAMIFALWLIGHAVLGIELVGIFRVWVAEAAFDGARQLVGWKPLNGYVGDGVERSAGDALLADERVAQRFYADAVAL
jgi:hypothetical protein